MATTTPNIGLTLPTGTDGWKRSVINGNFTILDTKIGAVGNTPLQTQINTLSSQIASEAVNMSQYLISAESEATCIMFRCGKVRTMTFQGVARVHTEDEVFMTVPEGDRVKGGNYIHCIGMVGGTPVVVRFNGSSGNLSIFILNGGTSNSRLYFQITWVTP